MEWDSETSSEVFAIGHFPAIRLKQPRGTCLGVWRRKGVGGLQGRLVGWLAFGSHVGRKLWVKPLSTGI